MLDFWLKSLRGRMILMAVVIVSVPILVAGYFMKTSAEESLLAEKRSKLVAIGAIMDDLLGPGGFQAILERAGAQNAPREEKIRVLNQGLAQLSDDIARSSPGLGAGFYCLELDAIITYAPQASFGHTVGQSILTTHPGRQVMATGRTRVEFGTLVRGDIMNAMRPIERNGRVQGYIFTNELNNDINAQLDAMDQGLRTSMTLGLTLGLALILVLTHGLLRDVNIIIRGLKDLRFDLSKPIRGLKGELGEVAATVNEMAVALADARSLSENIMESMAEGIVGVDTQGIVTTFNRSAARMTGLAPKDVIGLGHVQQVFGNHPRLAEMLGDTLHTGAVYQGEEMASPNPAGGGLALGLHPGAQEPGRTDDRRSLRVQRPHRDQTPGTAGQSGRQAGHPGRADGRCGSRNQKPPDQHQGLSAILSNSRNRRGARALSTHDA